MKKKFDLLYVGTPSQTPLEAVVVAALSLPPLSSASLCHRLQ